jgi:uncharacterized membrane protein YqjE
MNNGLEQLHDRELMERRRTRLYQLALTAAIVIVVFALAVAGLSVLAVE